MLYCILAFIAWLMVTTLCAKDGNSVIVTFSFRPDVVQGRSRNQNWFLHFSVSIYIFQIIDIVTYCSLSKRSNNLRHYSYSRGKNGKYPFYISTIDIGIHWQGKTYLKNAASLLNRVCVNRRALDLSKEVLWVSAKLWPVKIWRWSGSPGLELGPPSFGLNLAARQDFFQISNFDSLYFCSPLT